LAAFVSVFAPLCPLFSDEDSRYDATVLQRQLKEKTADCKEYRAHLENPFIWGDLQIFRKAYPDVRFSAVWNKSAGDFVLTVDCDGRRTELYYAGARYLLKEEREHAERYRRLIYPYNPTPEDPSGFSPERTADIKKFTLHENRLNAPVTPLAFFNAIYDSTSRRRVEQHIVKTTLFGRRINVHERIREPLSRVDAQVTTLARTDREAAAFLSDIYSVGCYSWREIRDTYGRSFHSLGIAIDILPHTWWNRDVYWADVKAMGNQDWMLLPLANRWMPPEKVRNIFLHEGFIWGGGWPVWDNMHFEYRPEEIYSNPHCPSN
jgi:hypothetical protein